MSLYSMIQTAFNAGELSPQVYGRSDIDRYSSACKTLLNTIPLVQGAAERRPGTEHIGTVKDSTKAVRLIPFNYSNTQAYVLEFGDQYIRFFKDGGQIHGGELVVNGSMEADSNWGDLNAPTTNDQSTDQQNAGLFSRKFISAATDDGIESDAFTVAAGDTLTFEAYAYHAAGANLRVKLYGGDGSVLKNQDYAVPAATWTLITFTALDAVGGALGQVSFSSASGVDTWYIDSVSAKKDSIYEISSPYLEAELWDIDFAQSADTMYFAHQDHEPRTLVRYSHDEWTLDTITFIAGPFMPVHTGVITMDLAATAVGTGVALVASAPVFYSTDVGRHFTQKHLDGTTTIWGLAVITGYTDSENVEVEILRAFHAHTANLNWKLGYWSDTTGYPGLVILDKERLIWAASEIHPQHIWMGKVAEYTDHEIGVNPEDGKEQAVVASDAVAVELGAKQVTPLVWLESMRQLAAGSTSIEWWLTSSTGQGAITANSKQAVKGSFNGSSNVAPAVMDNVLLYASRGKNVLRELYYSFESDSFVGENLSIISEHLTRSSGIAEMAYQKSPFSVCWMVREDGDLIGLTYNKVQQVKCLHRHTTDGFFESVTTIPGVVDDEIWFVIKRNINGSDVRYIERLHARFIEEDLADAFFVDSGLSLDNRQSIGSITHSDPGIVTLVGHGYVDTDMVLLRTVDDSVTGEESYDSLHYEELEVEKIDNDSFYLLDPDSARVDLSGYKQVVSATVAKLQTAVGGLSHLEGETVHVLADGSTEPPQVVSSGQITLTGSGASVIHAGLPYNSDLETLPPSIDFRNGTTLGDVKRIETVMLKMYRSLGLNIGHDVNSLKEYVFTSDTVPMSRPAPMLSGNTKEISFGGKRRTDVGIYLRQSEPLPMTVSAIIYNIDLGE